MKKLIETVPNFSEGRRKEIIDAIIDHISRKSRIRILDVSSDADHNRSVLTMVGGVEEIRSGIHALMEKAVESIDLRTHRGGHPRMGAVDVIPFVPIRGIDMRGCAELAGRLGREIAERFSIPVYLYEKAATRPERVNLAEIRKGEFEGFPEKIRDENWKPDFGPSEVHPTAGAVAMGARMPLIAYNVNLGTADIEVAKRIARAVRHSSGGLRYVKAMGVPLQERNLAQVSMNLVDFTKTPIHRVFEMIRSEAERYGVPVLGSEIVGLVPNDALLAAAEHFLRIENFDPLQVLENRISAETEPSP